MRDALHLTQPGGHPRPVGVVLRQWSRAVARPVSLAGLEKALDGVAADKIALCLDAAGATPVDRAALVIEAHCCALRGHPAPHSDLIRPPIPGHPATLSG